MSDSEEIEVPTVRKTRSGRTVAAKTPTKLKATPRRTRKKVVVMEVEITDDEDVEAPNPEPEQKRARLDDTEAEPEQPTPVVDEAPAETPLEAEELILNDVSMLDDVAEPTNGHTEAENGKTDEVELSVQPQEEEIEEHEESQPQNGDPQAENISDEELPQVAAVKVPETEEVSDDELPGPKRAELPADTEVVSEDELPKKEEEPKISDEIGYDPTSPTSENEGTAKKEEKKDDPTKKSEDKEEGKKPKKLPELDKYWKAVNDDPTDFTGWTYLLQYVDQENDMEAAREAYDAFLSHYPYCYGYWRKYADYEKRKGNKKKCEEVFERGFKAIPLSVDLWIHYLTYVKSIKPDDEEHIRQQFERALIACGLEFRSDRLWESYLKWETDSKRYQKVTAIYDRLLTTPTQNYTTHFDNFQEHVNAHSPNKILDVDEFMALRKEVRSMLKSEEKVAENADLPPGDEDSKLTEEESKCIRERIVSIRRKMHKNTVTAVQARWNYEEGIKRPYFHVKPLERCQLKNWQDYLDYEIEQEDKTRIVVLFERCLIACALYEEFWLKFVNYLENTAEAEESKIRDVYERACTIHHLKKPNLHLEWALFEENHANVQRAAEILVNLEKQVPNVLQVAYRRINLERRRNDYEKCQILFEHYVNNSKNKIVSSNVAIKYARFSLKVLKNYEKAYDILNGAITKDTQNPRLYLQLIDLILQQEGANVDRVTTILDEFLNRDGADADQKVLFAQRKLEFLEDFGADVGAVRAALLQFQTYQKLSKEAAKKKENKMKKEKAQSSAATTATSTQGTQPYGGYNYGGTTTPTAATAGTNQYNNYSGGGQQQQQQYNYSQYGQGDPQYQYQNWQYTQGAGAYGGYNQWGGYTGGYGY